MITRRIKTIQTIFYIKAGDRVRSTTGDDARGTVIEVDYTSLRVKWDDGVISLFHKWDGFVTFTPEATA